MHGTSDSLLLDECLNTQIISTKMQSRGQLIKRQRSEELLSPIVIVLIGTKNTKDLRPRMVRAQSGS